MALSPPPPPDLHAPPAPSLQTPGSLPAIVKAAFSKLDAALAAMVGAEGSDFSALSVAVVSGPNVVFEAAHGVVDRRASPPVAVTSDTLFRIGSITKLFPTLQLLQALDAGESARRLEWMRPVLSPLCARSSGH